MKATRLVALLVALVGAAQLASAQAFYPPPGFTGTVIGDNQISNGKFDTALTPWSGTGWEWNSGKARHLTGTTALASATPTITAGFQYRLTYTISSLTTGSITASIGGISQSTRSSNATFVDYVVAKDTSGISFTPSSSFDGRIDDIEMVRISEGQLIVDGTTTMHAGLVINGPITQVGTGYTNSFTSSGSGIQSGTTPPATCTTGDVFFDTDATAGSNIYGCTASNTWTLEGAFVSPGTGILADSGGGALINRTLTCGDGMTCTNGDGVAGNPTVTVNSSVMRKGSSSGAPASCGQGGDTFQVGDSYTDTATETTYLCAANTSPTGRWLPLNGGRGGLVIFDEFMSGAATTGNIGTFGWTIANLVAGAATIQLNLGRTDSPGVLTMNTSSSGFGSRIHTATRFKNATITGKDWYAEAGIVPGGVGSGIITDIAMNFGFVDAITATPTGQTGLITIGRQYAEGQTTTYVFAICDSSTTGCGSAGSATNQDAVSSTISPSTGVLQILKMWHLNAGVGGASTYYFQVNAETPKTACASGCDIGTSNVPTADMYFSPLFHETETAGARQTDMDYAKLVILGLSR